jgi:protoporphyrinogen/coproporphyrinogen III oxidase
VGLADAVVPSSKVVGLVRNGRVWDIDSSKPLSAMFTKALSWSAKWKLARGVMKLGPQMKGVNGFRLFDVAERDDPNINAYEWGVKYFGKEIADYLIDPLSRATVTTGASRSSWLRALGTLAGAADPLLNLRGGLDILPKAIAANLQIIYNATVNRVEAVAQGEGAKVACVSFVDEQGSSQQWTADVCIISAMYHDLDTIHPEIRQLASGFGDSIEDVNFLSVQMGFKVQSQSKAHVIQVPGIEDRDLIVMFQEHHKAPDRAPVGHSLINLYTDTQSFAHFERKTDQEVLDCALQTVEKLLPELKREHLEVANVGRWPKSGYLATPGSILRTRNMINQLPKQTTVFFAGNLFGAGSNMEGAVISGNAAARAVIASVG